MSFQPYANIYGFGQPTQPVAPQAGMQTGYQFPTYGGISGLSAEQPQWSPAGTAFTPPGSGGGGLGNWLGKDGNLGTVFGGIQALGSAYLGFEHLKAAKDALAFQKQAYGTNLANSTQTYNTSLEDRINGRTADHPGKDAEVQAYLAAHELKKTAV